MYDALVGAQWFSGRVVDSRAQASPASLRCVFEKDTLILAWYWFNPGRLIPFITDR